MKLASKLVVSLIIGLVAATLVSVIQTGQPIDALLLVAFGITSVAAALVGAGGARAVASPDRVTATPATDSAKVARTRAGQTSAVAADTAPASIPQGARVQGQVKWFNVSKGFGFIVTDAGQEIFVHFRSIRGRGRRGLKDGQRVSFVLANSDKGPQAEDVVAEGGN